MPREIDRKQLQRLQSAGAAIVEVLPHGEFDQEHLPGAINLPLEHLRRESAERHLGTDRQRPVVVYCQDVD